MAWNDLSIPQRSQLMNIYRRNGITSLSEMKRLYDLSYPSSPLVEDTLTPFRPQAPVYANGGPKTPYIYYEDNADFVGPRIPESFYAGPPTPPGYGEAPVNQEKVKLAQRYMESAMNDRAYNKGSKAPGTWQITPVVLEEFTKRTGKTGDLFDPVFNEEVRDWYMNVRLPEFQALKRGHPSDSVRTGIGLASFNAGPGTVNKALTKAQAAGIDTDRTFDWLKYLPKETQDYVNFGLRGKDIPGTSKTRENYQKVLDSLGVEYAKGGPKNNWFTRSTLNAAMADAPAVMQASGWDYDKDRNLYQGDPNAEGPTKLRESLAETAMMPFIDMGIGALGAAIAGSKGYKVFKVAREMNKALKNNKLVNVELTDKVIKALDNMSEAQKLGTSHIADGLKEYLINEGVDPGILTKQNLVYLTNLRQEALEKANQTGRYAVKQALRDPNDARYVLFDGIEGPKANRYVGYIDVSNLKDPQIDFVSNATRNQVNPARRVSESGMNAVIEDLGSVTSGRELLTPEATAKITDGYVGKELISNNGVRKIDGVRQNGFPVYRLTKQTNYVPVKYADIFSANGINDAGEFVIGNWANPYLANGGKIHIKLKNQDKKKSLFDKNKVLNRVYGDAQAFAEGNTGIQSSVWQYLFNKDNAVDKRIEDAELGAEKYRSILESEDPDLIYRTFRDLPKDEQRLFDLGRMVDVIKQHEDAKRLYLGYEPKYGTIERSKNKPTIGKSDNPYQINALLTDSEFDNLIVPLWSQWRTGIGDSVPVSEGYLGLKYSQKPRTEDKGKVALVKDLPFISDATMSEGFDDKGQYLSIYDIWDYNTNYIDTPGDNVGKFIGGKPFEIYQRYYLDDWFDIPESERGYPYIAPAYITAEKARGGKIHIKKKNRGKFTALKKRTGHSASWFKAHGTPAQKKMAVFALNSKHWGHKKLYGGIIF